MDENWLTFRVYATEFTQSFQVYDKASYDQYKLQLVHSEIKWNTQESY